MYTEVYYNLFDILRHSRIGQLLFRLSSYSLLFSIESFLQLRRSVFFKINETGFVGQKIVCHLLVHMPIMAIGPCWTNFFFHKNWRGGYWQHLVLTGRLYVPHSRNYTRCFAPCFWRSHYQPQSWCRLATSELRFDTVELLFVGCRQR